jgi:phospholipid/cholesterol/gamma-HCH transport system permease protein
VIGIVRELGPVLLGLMVAGRVSSAMAAELATMRVTEQLDAMATLRTDPYRYLIAPRLFAAVIALPLLVLVANAIGVLGGYLLSVYKLDFNAARYLETTRRFLEADDLVMSLVKAAVFGFFIALMGCYHGFRSGGGAAGVGRATTAAVVSAFILILLSNLAHHRGGFWMSSSIVIRDLHKSFGAKRVLAGLDLDVAPASRWP